MLMNVPFSSDIPHLYGMRAIDRFAHHAGGFDATSHSHSDALGGAADG